MITLKNVSKWYGHFQVLTDCSTEVKKGEVVVVCGPSGSGKSTLIKTVNGLEPVQQGQIIVDGTVVNDKKTNLAKLRSHVGMVFQHFELFPHLSIIDNLTLAQVKVHVAERTGDDHGVRAEGLRPFKDAAGKAGGDVAAGNAHGCAAAFRLQGERHDFGAEGGHDVVHGHRVLGVVKLHDVRGAAHQAAVVAGDLDAFEGLLDLFGDGAGTVVLLQDLEDGYGFGQLFGAGIVEKGVDLIAERLVLHTVLGGLQVGEAARAGRAHGRAVQAGDMGL